ncbi:MAG: NADP-dependent oxidoreductase, partial [Planctomycetota bacterium]
GVDRLQVREVATPQLDAGEVLIAVEYADVAVWDPEEREGELAAMAEQIYGQPPGFPLVLGSDGAGRIVAVGEGVDASRIGQRVYAGVFLSPKGGFYAEYTAVPASSAAAIPSGLSSREASSLGGDAVTALCGLDNTLKLRDGETVLIFGAGGGIGHAALQLAKRMGARVLAIASGPDGVELAQRLGADHAIDGRRDDIAEAAKAFAPTGIDAALLTAGGEAARQSLGTLRAGGRAAYPTGIEPVPEAPENTALHQFDGNGTPDVTDRLNQLIEAESDVPFHVEIARSFPMDEVAHAHRMLDQHYLGKLALQVSSNA